MKNQQPSNSRSKQIIRSKKEKQTKKETNNPKEQKHMRIKTKNVQTIRQKPFLISIRKTP